MYARCNGLNENSPHRPIGSGTLRTGGLLGEGVRGSVSLGVAFEALEAQVRPHVALSSCCLPM